MKRVNSTLRAALCVAACLLSAHGFAQSLTPEEAAKRVGMEVEVKGKVFATGFTRAKAGYWFKNLFFGGDTPRHVFRVRYRDEGLPGAERLPEKLALREVRVRGKVENITGDSRITVTDASQIEVLPLDVDAVLRAPVDSEAQRGLYSAAWRQILLNGDFAALEKQAAELLEKESRFVCGLWQITPFMGGLSQPETLADEDWSAHQEALEQWGKAFPKSSTQRIAWASFLINHGWKARGSGYASTVTEEGWRLFKERLNQARDVFSELPRDDWSPYAYMRCITLGMGLGLSSTEVTPVFTEGVQRWPEYHDLYFAEAVRLLPRWKGRPGEWEKWLALETTPETDVTDEIYARVVWAQADYYKNEKGVFEGSEAEWPRVKRGFEVMRKKYPESWWNLNAFARFAAYAADRDTAREIHKDLAGHEETSFWRGWTYFETCKRWAEGGASK